MVAGGPARSDARHLRGLVRGRPDQGGVRALLQGVADPRRPRLRRDAELQVLHQRGARPAALHPDADQPQGAGHRRHRAPAQPRGDRRDPPHLRDGASQPRAADRLRPQELGPAQAGRRLLADGLVLPALGRPRRHDRRLPRRADRLDHRRAALARPRRVACREQALVGDPPGRLPRPVLALPAAGGPHLRRDVQPGRPERLSRVPEARHGLALQAPVRLGEGRLVLRRPGERGALQPQLQQRRPDLRVRLQPRQERRDPRRTAGNRGRLLRERSRRPDRAATGTTSRSATTSTTPALRSARTRTTRGRAAG